jgi:hypothetical protein
MSDLINFDGLSFDRVYEIAGKLSKSDFIPVQFKNKPADIIIAWQLGSEIGLKPMQALNGMKVTNGRASVYGDLLKGLVVNRSDCISIEEGWDDGKGWCTVKRKGHVTVSRVFTREDAVKARLWGSSIPWSGYPGMMMMYRARGFAIRHAFPDVLCGIITTEEAQDYHNEESFKEQDIKLINENSAEAEYTREQFYQDAEDEIVEEEVAEKSTKAKLLDLLERKRISDDKKTAWLEKAQVESFEEMPDDKSEKLVKFITSKYGE